MLRWDYVFLGIALFELAKLSLMHWQFWAILTPFTVLNIMYEKTSKE